jgi:phage shock protein A
MAYLTFRDVMRALSNYGNDLANFADQARKQYGSELERADYQALQDLSEMGEEIRTQTAALGLKYNSLEDPQSVVEMSKAIARGMAEALRTSGITP